MAEKDTESKQKPVDGPPGESSGSAKTTNSSSDTAKSMTKKHDYLPELEPIIANLPTFNMWKSDLFLRTLNAIMYLPSLYFHYFEKKKAVQVKYHTIPGYQGKPIQVEVLYPKSYPSSPKQDDENNSTNPKLLPCLFYVHGGGFALDMVDGLYRNCIRYVRDENCIAVIPHMHSALSAPYPQGLFDCQEALDWTFSNAKDLLGVDKARIAVGGDSAGAMIAALLTQLRRDQKPKEPNVCFQLLVTPVLDHLQTSDSVKNLTDTPIINSEGVKEVWARYLRGVDTEDESLYLSPLHPPNKELGFRDLPPAYVEPAEFCPLRDEGVRYAQELEKAGVRPVEMHLAKGYPHGVDVVSDHLESTKQLLRKRASALHKSFQVSSLSGTSGDE